MEPRWKESILATLAIVAIAIALAKLPRDGAEIDVTAHAAQNHAALSHSPACEKIYASTGATLDRHVAEDRVAERENEAVRVRMVSDGVTPNDARVRELYAREDAEAVARQDRQWNELEQLKAQARAAGCTR